MCVEIIEEAHADEEEDACGEGADDERQDARMPQRETRPDAARAKGHRASPPSTNPTPLIVRMSFFGKDSSTFRRSRAKVTSMTLSSGVARALTFQTSCASISRDTTRPWWRSRYSRMSYSFPVSSSSWL